MKQLRTAQAMSVGRLVCYLMLLAITCGCSGSVRPDREPTRRMRVMLQVQRIAQFHYLFEREFAKDEAEALKVKRALLDALPATEQGLGEGRTIELPQLDKVSITARVSTEPVVDRQDRKIRQVLREKIGPDFEASKALTSVDSTLLDQVVAIVERRLGKSGLSNAEVRKQLPDKIAVEIPGVADPKAALTLVQRTALLEFKLLPADVRVTINEEGAPEFYRGDRQITTRRVLDEAPVVMTGSELEPRCRVVSGPTQDVQVAFAWKPAAASKFQEFTASHLKRHLAIVLDGELISAPVIQSPIGRHGIITGDFTAREAVELANLLNAGALPAPLAVVEDSTQ